MKELKQRSAHAVLEAVRARQGIPECRAALRAFRLPPTVHHHAHFRVWQRRFVPFNVYTEKKRLEKLDYMHHNPVKRRHFDDGPPDLTRISPTESQSFTLRQPAARAHVSGGQNRLPPR